MFIFLQKDAFLSLAKKVSEGTDRYGKDQYSRSTVRRPTRGIQIKDDTYAMLSIRRAGGEPIPLVSSSAFSNGIGYVEQYSDFIIQQINEERSEKEQIVETFGDPYVFFYGERPRVISVTGMLLNTEDFNWKSQFWKNYDEFLRGTQLVRANARAYLCYDTIVIEGYPLRASAQDSADNPYMIPFQMTMLVTNTFDSSDIGLTKFPYPPDYLGDYDALNVELSKRRSQFSASSTSSEIRRNNLLASQKKGILAGLRGALTKFNEVMAWANYGISALTNALSGRNIVVPMGVAGYLEAVGEPTISWAGSTGIPITIWDSVTGKYKTVNGSLKLRMPPAAYFAPSGPKGYIWENYDEYPQLTRNLWQAQDIANPFSGSDLTTLMSATDYSKLQNNTIKRVTAFQKKEKDVLAWETLNGGGGILGGIAAGVRFLKSAFGLAMTAASFIEDPQTGFYGLTGYPMSGVGNGIPEERVTSDSRKQQLSAAGIKTSSAQKTSNSFLGITPFAASVASIKTISRGEGLTVETEEKEFGASYNNVQYKSTPEASYQYETTPSAASRQIEKSQLTAADINYQNIVRSQNLDPMNSILGVTVGKKTIYEGTGSTDNASTTAISDLKALSKNNSTPVGSNLETKAKNLMQTNTNSPTEDIDTTGIRGIDDEESYIPAVV
jgi:hypothetical protein